MNTGRQETSRWEQTQNTRNKYGAKNVYLSIYIPHKKTIIKKQSREEEKSGILVLEMDRDNWDIFSNLLEHATGADIYIYIYIPMQKRQT
jgi:hypothetical protein